MARELVERDIKLLIRLAPECEDLVCSGSGRSFHSVLPPVANHFSRDAADFRDRITRMPDDDLSYLTGLVLSGGESLGCIDPEMVDIFVREVASRIGEETAKSVVRVYAAGDDCEV